MSKFFHTNEKEFQNNFKTGAVIYIKCDTSLKPLFTVIQSREADNITFRVDDSFLNERALKGSPMTGQLLTSKYEYVFKGMLIDVQIAYPHNASMIIDKVERYPNKRKAKRYNVNIPANIISGKEDKLQYIVVKNISETGLCFATNDKFKIKEKVKLRFNNPVTKEDLELRGAIIRAGDCNGVCEYGVINLHIDEHNKENLGTLLNKLEDDEKYMIAEYLK
jgi:hypothetical protein